jgi:hypothetical protein
MVTTTTLNLPIIDLSSPDRISTANSIRQVFVYYSSYSYQLLQHLRKIHIVVYYILQLF